MSEFDRLRERNRPTPAELRASAEQSKQYELERTKVRECHERRLGLQEKFHARMEARGNPRALPVAQVLKPGKEKCTFFGKTPYFAPAEYALVPDLFARPAEILQTY